MEKLIGKQIVKIFFDPDEQQFITFRSADGKDLAYEAYADCCSMTWIEEILNPELIINQQVLKVNELEVVAKTVEHEDYYDGMYIQTYGYQILSQKGICEIIFRNESNGYYGGDLHECSPDKHKNLFEVTKDWSVNNGK